MRQRVGNDIRRLYSVEEQNRSAPAGPCTMRTRILSRTEVRAVDTPAGEIDASQVSPEELENNGASRDRPTDQFVKYATWAFVLVARLWTIFVSGFASILESCGESLYAEGRCMTCVASTTTTAAANAAATRKSVRLRLIVDHSAMMIVKETASESKVCVQVWVVCKGPEEEGERAAGVERSTSPRHAPFSTPRARTRTASCRAAFYEEGWVEGRGASQIASTEGARTGHRYARSACPAHRGAHPQREGEPGRAVHAVAADPPGVGALLWNPRGRRARGVTRRTRGRVDGADARMPGCSATASLRCRRTEA